jgi:effector-binding domain-containing protein
MKYVALCAVLAVLTLITTGCITNLKEASYEVVSSDGDFEIRQYDSQILAEIVVDETLEEAGNKAFNKLFKYISGENTTQVEIAMTAPVSQEAESAEIEMTAPVGQEKVEQGWRVSFMMPQEYTMATIPKPTNPKVTLREVKARRVAAIRYSGGWSKAGYETHLDKLEAWVKEQNLSVNGNISWARYNPPFTPDFMKRNEILIPIDGGSADEKEESK